MYSIWDLNEPLWVASNLSLLPPLLFTDFGTKRPIRDAEIKEILVVELGDGVAKTPYLIVSQSVIHVTTHTYATQLRTADDEIVLYESFSSQSNADGEVNSSKPGLVRVLMPGWIGAVSEPQGDQASLMRVASDIGGSSMVFIPGDCPRFLLKSATSPPRLVRLRGKGVKGMSSFHTPDCSKGWVYVDAEVIRSD